MPFKSRNPFQILEGRTYVWDLKSFGMKNSFRFASVRPMLLAVFAY